MSSGTKPSFAVKRFRDDEVLVRDCLAGSEAAWSELIDKYKNLIFSIPVKYGMNREDASEIFQSVSLALLSDLPQLREPRALGAWLIRLTIRKCIRFKREGVHSAGIEIDEGVVAEKGQLPGEMLEEIEREQVFRQALAETTPDCSRLIDLLFFEDPPMSYDAAAQALGMAKGSIGATRMRCLEKLRRVLEKKGFR
jgi:RNA polymerase sigma factor (sigma-70 family)